MFYICFNTLKVLRKHTCLAYRANFPHYTCICGQIMLIYNSVHVVGLLIDGNQFIVTETQASTVGAIQKATNSLSMPNSERTCTKMLEFQPFNHRLLSSKIQSKFKVNWNKIIFLSYHNQWKNNIPKETTIYNLNTVYLMKGIVW